LREFGQRGANRLADRDPIGRPRVGQRATSDQHVKVIRPELDQ
jgi:hypothetical protein